MGVLLVALDPGNPEPLPHIFLLLIQFYGSLDLLPAPQIPIIINIWLDHLPLLLIIFDENWVYRVVLYAMQVLGVGFLLEYVDAVGLEQ